MTKKAKLLERVRNSPKDAMFSEVQKLRRAEDRTAMTDPRIFICFYVRK